MRYFLLLFLFVGFKGFCQDPTRFSDQVEAIQKKYDTLWDSSKETVVFTGSSSVRIWRDLEARFPEHHIVNSGFGGSQASDLIFYLKQLVLRFNPKKVFIYEGDNDINAKKRPRKILQDLKNIAEVIKAKRSDTEIVLIAAKPSVARWQLKGKYKRLNNKMRRFAKKRADVSFANVWDAMLDGKEVKTDIFIKDKLHMNAKGYELWYDVIKNYMD
ncbi:MAG: GDSL-type esterase/lipase family protein [Aurantibacter sp.]